MIQKTQFTVNYDDELTVTGEYEGTIDSGKVIVFSHGFGMKRDSRGFFTEIGNSLRNSFLIVTFDYCKMMPEENATLTYAFSVQVKLLQKVVEFIRSKFNVSELDVIAHSMGCLVVGLAELEDVKKIILLSPPPSKRIQKMQTYFNHKQGSEFNTQGFSKVKRSDGSWTFIHPDFWNEVKIVDPAKLYKKLSKTADTYFVRALHDDVITDESYSEIQIIDRLHYIELDGDHNFKEPNRKKLLDTITKIFD